MSKITKLLALMLAVVFALSLVACTGEKAPEPNETTEPVVTEEGETTTTTKAGKKPNKNDKTDAQEDEGGEVVTTTKKRSDKEEAALYDPRHGTGALVVRTTNRAGAASSKFIKSLKGFTLKILYPWENIYGEKKCQVAAEDSIKSVEQLYGKKIVEEGQFNRYNENLASELAARNCENHIYFAQGGYFPSYFQKGYIADLTPAMRETGIDFNEPWYMSEAKGFLNIDGKQYGWTATEDEYMSPGMLLYNKRLLNTKRLQDPRKLAEQGKWTWDVLEKYARKFDNDKSVIGFGTVDNLSLFETIAMNYGTTLTKVSRGSQPTTNITNSKVESALTEYGSWTTGKNAWCDTFYGKSWSYGKTQFHEGKVAMIFGGHDTIQGLKGTSTQKDVDVVPFPTKKGSKTYKNLCGASFIAFIPSVHQNVASKALFVRNEYYRYNYRFIERNFQYKWESYFGKNKEAIAHSAEIKYSKNGNKAFITYTNVCESTDEGSTTSASVINEVISGRSTAAQAISSKKNALIKSYADVWKGHIITGNV